MMLPPVNDALPTVDVLSVPRTVWLIVALPPLVLSTRVEAAEFNEKSLLPEVTDNVPRVVKVPLKPCEIAPVEPVAIVMLPLVEVMALIEMLPLNVAGLALKVPPFKNPLLTNIVPPVICGVAELITTVPPVKAELLIAPTLTPLPMAVKLPPVPDAASAVDVMVPNVMEPVATANTLPADLLAPVELVLMLVLPRLMLPGEAAAPVIWYEVLLGPTVPAVAGVKL